MVREYIHVDDEAQVTFEGRVPARLCWGGITYVVVGTPQEWVHHEPWWRGVAGPMDVVVWRLSVRPLPGQKVIRSREVDVKPAGGSWRVMGEML